MDRKIVALVRHGDYNQLTNTPSAHQPFPLSEAGEEHARIAAKEFAKTLEQKQWQLHPKIHSSHMLRAWQTADIYSKRQKNRDQLEISCHDALAERSVGAAANLSMDTIEEVIAADPRYPAPPEGWKSDSHYRLPLQGAESLMQAGQRVAAHLWDQMNNLPEQPGEDRVMLFFGHGAAFRHAAHVMGIIEFDQIAQLSMYHARPLFIEYLEDGHWRHIAGEWKARSPEELPVD